MCYRCINTGNDGFLVHMVNYSFKPPVDFYHYVNNVWQKFEAIKTSLFHPLSVDSLNGYLPMGVELETQVVDNCGCEDCDEGDDYRCTDERDDLVNDIMHDIHDKLVCDDKSFSMWRQLVIAKYDGSLNYGIEFVTQPMTVKAHKELNWIRSLHHRGIYSYSTQNTGIHVHIPKAFFTTKTLWLFLALHEQFIQRSEDRDMFEYISGRKDRGYARWRMPYYDNGYERTDKMNVAKNKRMDSERSSMLNLHPSYTIELRYFKGNINYETVHGQLEFIQAMYDFVNIIDKCVPPIVLQRVKEDYVQHFIQFVYVNSEEYPLFAKRLLNTRKWGVNSGYVDMNLTEKEIISNGRRIS